MYRSVTIQKALQHCRPLRRHRVLSISSFVLHLTAFVLLLLVGLSLTIIKAIYLLALKANGNRIATSLATELRFGVWGVCASSSLRAPTAFDNDGVCLGPHLGYQIPPELLALIGLPPSLANLILTALLVVLVLHPIAAGFSFLAFISSLYLASHPVAIFGLVTSIIASLLATIVLAVDISIAVVVRDKLNEFLSGGFTVVWGNAIWMVLAATVCSWGGVIILSARVCYCCGIRRRDTY